MDDPPPPRKVYLRGIINLTSTTVHKLLYTSMLIIIIVICIVPIPVYFNFMNTYGINSQIDV